MSICVPKIPPVRLSQAAARPYFRRQTVSDSAQVKALVARAVSEFGALDVAFNNAGLLPPTAPLAEQTEDDWARIMRVDVTGVFFCLKHELAQMAKAGRGVIVNTASVAGLRADPGMAPYVAAKHAVVGLTKAAAIDYAAMGIRVNAIAPGLVRTPMTERWLNDPQMREKVLADSPIRRAAEPEDIAGLVLFLASDLANIITGAVYPVDCARTAH
jgi:NAD(P)-dependent dehydrogenase (short-subunit alcohol dehydrogenase family)